METDAIVQVESPFSSLPSADLLHAIIKYLNGFEIMLLYICGCRHLNRLMTQSRGTVDRFCALEIDFNAYSKSPLWPFHSLYRFPNLTNITIKNGSSIFQGVNGHILNSFPSSLEKIEFIFHQAQNGWLEIPKQLPCSSITEDKITVCADRIFDVGKKFPNLKHLQLASPTWKTLPFWTSTRQVLSRSQSLYSDSKHTLEIEPVILCEISWTRKLKQEFVSSLPASLTYLHLWEANINSIASFLPPNLETLIVAPRKSKFYVLDEFISRLPKKITTLYLNRPTCNSHPFRDCPPNLTDLTLLNIDKFNDTDVMDLPKSLRSLLVTPTKNWTDLAIYYLPRNLTNLNIWVNSLLTDDCIPYIPPNLISLRLGESKITQQLISQLPRSLIEFTWASCAHIDDETCQSFPPNLTKLHLPYNHSLTDESIKYLPRTITELNLRQNENLTPKCIPDLPPGLRDFDIFYNQNFINADENDLPKSLTTYQHDNRPKIIKRRDNNQ